MGSVSRLLHHREQVAAVCYRRRGADIEFLLVQSRGGRWIFPKGGVEPGLTRAQSAALEALEEAGVRGRIETISFARYVRRRGDDSRRSSPDSIEASTFVHAFLCEVRKLIKPQEKNRNRTWLTPKKARQRLQENRAAESGHELADVVDRAVSRIRRLQQSAENLRALRAVHLEPNEHSSALTRERAVALTRYHSDQRASMIAGAPPELMLPGRRGRAQLRLVAGPNTTSRNK